MFTGPLPDITPAQWLAVVLWAASQAVAWGWINSAPRQITLSAAATVLAAVWHYADAKLRGHRNDAKAAADVGAIAIHDASQKLG